MSASLKRTLRTLAAASYSIGGACLAIALALTIGAQPAAADSFSVTCPSVTSGLSVQGSYFTPGNTGEKSQLQVSWSESGPIETYGPPLSGGGTFDHTYPTAGTYTITAVLIHNVEKGQDGGSSSCEATVVVASPTETSVPPTETSVPPTETSVPPTETSVPPTETSVPPTAVPPTSAPPTDNPPPQTVVQPTAEPVLIPVTGVSLAGQRAWMPRWFFNLGLAFVGMGMVLHGLSFKVKREE